MRRHIILFAALLFSAATLPAHADTITTNFSVGFTNLTGPEENLFGVLQFNPALGTLNSITATLTGNVTFVPDNSGNSSYELTLDSPFGFIFRQTYTSSSAIAISVTDPNTGGFVGINHVILDPDVSVTGGSASTVPTTLAGTFTYNYTPAPTPEPSSFALLLTGLCTVAGAAGKPFTART